MKAAAARSFVFQDGVSKPRHVESFKVPRPEHSGQRAGKRIPEVRHYEFEQRFAETASFRPFIQNSGVAL